jgi:hypothetical protein
VQRLDRSVDWRPSTASVIVDDVRMVAPLSVAERKTFVRLL